MACTADRASAWSRGASGGADAGRAAAGEGVRGAWTTAALGVAPPQAESAIATGRARSVRIGQGCLGSTRSCKFSRVSIRNNVETARAIDAWHRPSKCAWAHLAMMSASTPSVPPTSLETPALRAAMLSHRATLLRRLEAGEDGIALGQSNARFLNACIRLLFEGAARRSRLPGGIALAAVGSFGRGAVALHSDADVVLIVDSRVEAKEASAVAEALLYPLWDAGIAVGHQVLSATDTSSLAREDLATATALLDMRLLAGDEALLRALLSGTGEGLFGEIDLGA